MDISWCKGCIGWADDKLNDGRMHGTSGGGELANVWATLWEGDDKAMHVVERLAEMTVEYRCWPQERLGC